MKLPPIIQPTRHKVGIAIREWFCDSPKSGAVESTWGLAVRNSSLCRYRVMYLAPARVPPFHSGSAGRGPHGQPRYCAGVRTSPFYIAFPTWLKVQFTLCRDVAPSPMGETCPLTPVTLPQIAGEV